MSASPTFPEEWWEAMLDLCLLARAAPLSGPKWGTLAGLSLMALTDCLCSTISFSIFSNSRRDAFLT